MFRFGDACFQFNNNLIHEKTLIVDNRFHRIMITFASSVVLSLTDAFMFWSKLFFNFCTSKKYKKSKINTWIMKYIYIHTHLLPFFFSVFPVHCDEIASTWPTPWKNWQNLLLLFHRIEKMNNLLSIRAHWVCAWSLRVVVQQAIDQHAPSLQMCFFLKKNIIYVYENVPESKPEVVDQVWQYRRQPFTIKFKYNMIRNIKGNKNKKGMLLLLLLFLDWSKTQLVSAQLFCVVVDDANERLWQTASHLRWRALVEIIDAIFIFLYAY